MKCTVKTCSANSLLLRIREFKWVCKSETEFVTPPANDGLSDELSQETDIKWAYENQEIVEQNIKMKQGCQPASADHEYE